MIGFNNIKGFDSFRQKRNKLLFSCIFCDSIALLILAGSFYYTFSFIDEDEQESYVLFLVYLYLFFTLFHLPAFFRVKAYDEFCNIIIFTQTHRDLVEKRSQLINTIIEENNIDSPEISKFLNYYNTDYQPVLKAKNFDIEEAIKLWISSYSNYFTAKQKKDLQSIEDECNRNLLSYLNAAICYYKHYDKNIKTRRFREPLIPPKYFDETDIAFFYEIKKLYH